jgi:predicted nucleotidyltransferase
VRQALAYDEFIKKLSQRPCACPLIKSKLLVMPLRTPLGMVRRCGCLARAWMTQKKGGDIDLLVRPDPSQLAQPFIKKIRMLTVLERLLAERKIDLVIEQPGDVRPIVSVAHATGIQIQ